MKTGRISKVGAVAIVVSAFLLATGDRFVPGRGVQAALAVEKTVSVSATGGTFAGRFSTRAMPLGLPSEDTAKIVLNASLPHHHPQWLEVPMGSVKIRVFVIYPDLGDTAPVAVVTARNQGLSDWVRAVGTEVVNEGYITVVPDLLSGLGRTAAVLTRSPPMKLSRRRSPAWAKVRPSAGRKPCATIS